MITTYTEPIGIIIEDLAPSPLFNPQLGLKMRIKHNTTTMDLVRGAFNAFILDLSIEHYYESDPEKTTINGDFIKPYGKKIQVDTQGQAYVEVVKDQNDLWVQASLPFKPDENTSIEDLEADTSKFYMKEWEYFAYMYNNRIVSIPQIVISVINRYHQLGLL